MSIHDRGGTRSSNYRKPMRAGTDSKFDHPYAIAGESKVIWILAEINQIYVLGNRRTPCNSLTNVKIKCLNTIKDKQ